MSTQITKFQDTVQNGLVNVKELTNLPLFVDNCIQTMNKIKGRDLEDPRGKAEFEVEKINFANQVAGNGKLQKCTPISLYKAFLECMANGLSFSPQKKLNYLIPYGTEARNEVSPYGEAQMRIDQGIILGHDDPVIVWDCDHFEPEHKDGRLSVVHRPKFPRPAEAKIIAAFIIIEQHNGRLSTSVFGADEIEKFKSKSKNKALYEWEGMIKAKVLKHAMKRQPQARILGVNTRLQSEDRIEKIDYGLPSETLENQPETITLNPETEPETPPQQDGDFSEEAF